MLNGDKKPGEAIDIEKLLAMTRNGLRKARAGQMQAPFELMGASITLALVPQHDVARIMAGSNITSMAGLIERFGVKLKDKKLSDDQRKEILDEMKQSIENPLRSQEETLGRDIAPFVVDIREPKVSDEKSSYVTLGWIVQLGVILDDYQSDMADLKVPFDEKLAEQLLIGSRFFKNWVMERMSDVRGFYNAIREDELGNSARSQPGSSKTGSKDATIALIPSSKSPGAGTSSSGISTAKPPGESSTQEVNDS